MFVALLCSSMNLGRNPMNKLSSISALALRIVAGWDWATTKVIRLAAVVGALAAVVATLYSAYNFYNARLEAEDKKIESGKQLLAGPRPRVSDGDDVRA